MYKPEFIEELKERIGFGEPQDLPNSISVELKHIEGATHQTFGYYHRLVTLENLYMTARKINMDSAEFNAYLDQLKEDAVRAALNRLHIMCKTCTKYQAVLIDTPGLLDDAIGYYVATTALEAILSTARINSDERNAMFRYDKLKIELDGMVHTSGRIISEGLMARRKEALYDLWNALCTDKPYIEDANCW